MQSNAKQRIATTNKYQLPVKKNKYSVLKKNILVYRASTPTNIYTHVQMYINIYIKTQNAHIQSCIIITWLLVIMTEGAQARKGGI